VLLPFVSFINSISRWGSLQRSPRPPSWILGGLLLRGKGKGRDEKGEEGRGEEGREKGEKRDGEWRDGEHGSRRIRYLSKKIREF